MQVSVQRTDLLDWSRNQTGCTEALHRKLSSFHWISPRSCFESSFGEAYLPVSRQRSFCYPWSSSPRKHVFSWVWFHRRLPRRIGRLPHRRTKMKNERMHDLITVLNLDIMRSCSIFMLSNYFNRWTSAFPPQISCVVKLCKSFSKLEIFFNEIDILYLESEIRNITFF